MSTIEVKKKLFGSVSIEDAIKIAEPGDTILIEPGSYKIENQIVLLQNLNIKSKIKNTVNLSGLITIKSSVNFENINISNALDKSIDVKEGGSAFFTNCKISNSCKKNPAVTIEENAEAVFSKTHFHTISTGGVLISTGGKAEFSECEFWECANYLILVENKNSSLILKKCLMRNSNGDGVCVSDGAHLEIYNSKIHDIFGNGIIIKNAGFANIDNCELFGFTEKSFAVNILNNGTGVIKNTKIYNNIGGGVFVNQGSKANLVKCEIKNCAKNAIIAHGSTTELNLTNCKLINIVNCGIHVFNNAKIQEIDCVFENCGNDESIRIEKDDQKMNEINQNNSSLRKKDELETNIITSSKIKALSQETIVEELELSLRGMVGVNEFISNFSYELKSFLEQKNKSRGVVLWGNSSVGKTEIAKRICGLSSEKNYAVKIPEINFKYIACCDEQLSPKNIVASVEDGTVLFLDEIDKYLSPVSGITDESQAKGLRNSLITNFNSKAILWVFTGTFSDIRGNNKLSKDILSKTLGNELTSRLDFADWQLNDWTLKSLMEAAQNSILSKDNFIEYEDLALHTLCEYILKHGGGIRTLEKCHESIKRLNQALFKNKNSKVLISNELVLDLIKREGP